MQKEVAKYFKGQLFYVVDKRTGKIVGIVRLKKKKYLVFIKKNSSKISHNDLKRMRRFNGEYVSLYGVCNLK